MLKVCIECGTQYERDAHYCNVCRKESLVPFEPPPEPTPPRTPLGEDRYAVIIAAVTWFAGIGYLVGELRPREVTTLLYGWLTMTIITLVVGMIVKNVRVFVLFSGIGLLCCAIYVVVRNT